MKFKIELVNKMIKITESSTTEIWHIVQSEDNFKFYIISDKGFNGFEGEGDNDLEKAIKKVKILIKNN